MARKGKTPTRSTEISGGELSIDDLDHVVGGHGGGVVTPQHPVDPIAADHTAIAAAAAHLQSDQATMAAATQAQAHAQAQLTTDQQHLQALGAHVTTLDAANQQLAHDQSALTAAQKLDSQLHSEASASAHGHSPMGGYYSQQAAQEDRIVAADKAQILSDQSTLKVLHDHPDLIQAVLNDQSAITQAQQHFSAAAAAATTDATAVITDINKAVADHAITAGAALTQFVEISAVAPSARDAMTHEIVNLVHSGQVAGADAVTTLTGLVTGHIAPATGITAGHADLQLAAVEALAGIGVDAHANTHLQSLVIDGIGTAAAGGDATTMVHTLLSACPHTSDNLQFIGDALANMVTHGVDAQVAVNGVTSGLSRSDAQTVLIEMADSGSAALRGTVANSLLSYGVLSDQSFMANHLSDGLAQALIVQNIITNHVSSSGAMQQLQHLESLYLQAHPSADKSLAASISLALLDLAVHAGIAEHPATAQATQINNLLGQINTLPNLLSVLSGCGALQSMQTSAAGLNDVLNLEHQAVIDLYALNDTGWQAVQDKVSAAIDTGVNAVWNFAADKSPIFGDLKNEVIADPTNYQGYIDLYSQVYAAAAPTGIGMEISLTSKLMAAAFESDALQHTLGKNAAGAIAAPFAIVSATCTAITQSIAGIVDYGTTNIAHGAIALGNLANDLAHGNTASAGADAKALGDALLQNFTGGISLQQAETLGSDQGKMWSDIFHGDNPAGDAKQFGNDLLSTLENNPGVKAVETAFTNAFTAPSFTTLFSGLADYSGTHFTPAQTRGIVDGARAYAGAHGKP